MPHAFDGNRFSRVLADAERLAADTLDHERRLTELVSLVEQATAARKAAPRRADLLDAIRDACLEAGEQRQLAEAIVSRLAGDVADDAAPHSARGRVLIVDDAEDNRDIAALVLEQSGYLATTASNGLEGLIVAHYVNPTVVLMDIAMPVLGGIEAARLLKVSAITRDIPVLAYTATPLNADGWLSRLFADVVRKPATPDDIVGAVARVAGATG